MTTYEKIVSYIKSALPELTNQSEASMDKKIASAIAPVIDNTITELSNTQDVITNIIGTQRYGKSLYYIQKALQYQEGGTLIVDSNFDYNYQTVNTNLLLIKQAALIVNDSGNTQILTMKVARQDPNGSGLIALGDKLPAFNDYMKLFEIPGIPILIDSRSANIFSFLASVTYYSAYNLETIKSLLSSYLTSFRDSFEFNGVLYVNDLETYLKNNIPGIRNVSLSNTSIDSTGFTDFTILQAGYFDFSDNIENQFTYVAI